MKTSDLYRRRERAHVFRAFGVNVMVLAAAFIFQSAVLAGIAIWIAFFQAKNVREVNRLLEVLDRVEANPRLAFPKEIGDLTWHDLNEINKFHKMGIS